jgi:hypothetical protein
MWFQRFSPDIDFRQIGHHNASMSKSPYEWIIFSPRAPRPALRLASLCTAPQRLGAEQNLIAHFQPRRATGLARQNVDRIQRKSGEKRSR